MTIVRTLLALLVLCLAMGAAAAEDSPVSVVFAHPETYIRQLKDLNYLTHAAPVTSDELRYEKALLLDWLRKELREAAGS